MQSNAITNALIQRYKNNKVQKVLFPDKPAAEKFVDTLFHFLFTSNHWYTTNLEETICNEYKAIQNLLSNILVATELDKQVILRHTNDFFEALLTIYKRLLQDADAILSFDPAATSVEEIFMTYPGFYATVVHRIANQLNKQGIKTLPRLLAEYAHDKTGIDIHPAATIGYPFFIDHGTGIVIGATATIGNNVKIYQGVTLGALNVMKSLASIKRHPTIEDNVVIYAGATILGGETIIGHDSTIGGNVWLTASVPPYSVVYQKSEIKMKNNFTESASEFDFII